jgi:hypothetical protein
LETGKKLGIENFGKTLQALSRTPTPHPHPPIQRFRILEDLLFFSSFFAFRNMGWKVEKKMLFGIWDGK